MPLFSPSLTWFPQIHAWGVGSNLLPHLGCVGSNWRKHVSRSLGLRFLARPGLQNTLFLVTVTIVYLATHHSCYQYQQTTRSHLPAFWALMAPALFLSCVSCQMSDIYCVCQDGLILNMQIFFCFCLLEFFAFTIFLSWLFYTLLIAIWYSTIDIPCFTRHVLYWFLFCCLVSSYHMLSDWRDL